MDQSQFRVNKLNLKIEQRGNPGKTRVLYEAMAEEKKHFRWWRGRWRGWWRWCCCCWKSSVTSLCPAHTPSSVWGHRGPNYFAHCKTSYCKTAKLLCTLQNFTLQNCFTHLSAHCKTAHYCTEAKLLCTLLCSASHFIAVGLKLLARVQHSALVFALLQWSIADCSFVRFWTVCTCAVCSVQCSAREGKGMCNAVQCNAVQGKVRVGAMQCSTREGCVRAWNSRRTHTGHHLHWSKGRATKRMTANNDDDAEEAGVTKKTLYGETPIFEH